MRGEHLPISTWQSGQYSSSGSVYLDASVWRDFVSWISPSSVTDVFRLRNLKTRSWKVFIFRDHLNRCFGRERQRDNALEGLGIEVINASGLGKITDKDELFLAEVMRVYFENDPAARRMAEVLILARRHSPSEWITLITQHQGFHRIPMVNTFYLDQTSLKGNKDVPATFDFLTDLEIHPEISQAVRLELSNSNHAYVLNEAFIALRNYVRTKSGLSDDGGVLMNNAFNPNGPKIKVNPLTDINPRHTQMNEQEGFQKISLGLVKAVRNPLAHEGTSSTFAQTRFPDKKTLYKFLSLFSILCERCDQPLP